MLSEQGGACILCPAIPTCVDHSPGTGTVRGLLCDPCNLKMAVVDDGEWLAKAMAYRERR